MPRCSPDGVGPRHTTDERRHHHVLEGRELRKEMVELEHEADAFVPEPRDPVVTHGIEVRAAVEHFATRGPLQASQDMEQGALADARGADDGEHLTLPDIQVDPVEHVERLRAAHERLAELLNLNESGFYFFSPFLSDSFSFYTVISMVEVFCCISSLISLACFPAPPSFLPAAFSRRDKIQSAKLRCYNEWEFNGLKRSWEIKNKQVRRLRPENPGGPGLP